MRGEIVRWTEEQLTAHEAKKELTEIGRLHGLPVATEEVEQNAVARYLDLIGVHWFHVPNGGKRNVVVAKKLKSAGVKAGVPDIWITSAPPLYPTAPGVIIEMKRIKGGVTSPEQREWLMHLGGRGWICCIAKGANEAMDFIKSVGW